MCETGSEPESVGCLQVTGSKCEEQVLNAVEAYTEFRPELAHRAINQLFDIARIQHCSQLLRALQVRPGPSAPGSGSGPVVTVALSFSW